MVRSRIHSRAWRRVGALISRTSLLAVVLAGSLAGALAGCGSEAEPSGVPSVGVSGEPSGAGDSAVGSTAAGSSGVGATATVSSELRVAPGVTCDQDVSSDEAKTTIERVGGLRQPTWSVRFAESTAAGVVALVTGDLGAAEVRLFDDYGVAAIVGSPEGQQRADDFRAVREAVRRICA